MRNEYPVLYLHAVQKKDLPSNTPVINSGDLEYFMWVKVPNDIGRVFEMYELHEQEEPYANQNLRLMCSHEKGRPWYRFLTEHLCRCPGLHVYRMMMVNVITNDTISLYFAYVIQEDNPKKPYIYMEHDGKCGVCAKNH